MNMTQKTMPMETDTTRVEKIVEQAHRDMEAKRFMSAFTALRDLLAVHPGCERARELYDRILYGGEYPERVIIEPTNYCAMACPVCSGRGGEVGFMPLEKFERLMEELGPKLREVWLHQRGDPFYHKDIYDFIDIVGRYKYLSCVMHTHGCHMLDIERLAATKTKLELVFSVDGADQESLTRYRTNGDFELVLENMRRLLALRNKRGQEFPRVVWKYIVMKPNEHLAEAAKKLAEEIGVDRFAFSEFGINWTTPLMKNFKPLMERFVPTDRNFFHEDYEAAMEGRIKRRTPQSPHCFHVNVVKATVRWNGSLIPCCMSIKPHENVMGNVFESGFKPIWDSEKYREFRKASVLEPASLIPCDRCAIIF